MESTVVVLSTQVTKPKADVVLGDQYGKENKFEDNV